MAKRHNVFISYYYEQDKECKDRLVRALGDGIVDMSVNIGDIVDVQNPTEATLQRIREDHIAQVSVTIVLIGPCTWQRKYVDWEIGASLRDTPTNPRCGLLGILLPTHPAHGKERYDPHLIPPRLAANTGGDDPYALVYRWALDKEEILGWIHRAFLRRKKQPDPDISLKPFGRNWNRPCSEGWQG